MSSSDLAISVRGLSKAYTIRHKDEHQSTLIEQLMYRARHPLIRQQRETFWALRDVSFDVHKGEVLGLIGRNGAGKSTLLKLLSRITHPTKGEARIYGRVGTLLEVGSGFHHELTGRENVYLNGAILGMRTKEIDRRFDEIVDFAGVEKFLDTPVKRYSSGMYVRLAFAVAAHLDTEILLVDEVLAVGDAEFQRKCLGKMGEVGSLGRTVIFVSHSMHSISTICETGIFLQGGSVERAGAIGDVIERYTAMDHHDLQPVLSSAGRRNACDMHLVGAAPTQPTFRPDEPKRFRFKLDTPSGRTQPHWLTVVVKDDLSSEIAPCDSRALDFELDPAHHDVVFELRHPWLKPGKYRIDVQVYTAGPIVDEYRDVCSFVVAPVLPYPAAVDDGVFEHGAVLGDYSYSHADVLTECGEH